MGAFWVQVMLLAGLLVGMFLGVAASLALMLWG